MATTARQADGRKFETEPAVFHYAKPEPQDRKGGIHLATTAHGGINIKVLGEGGENNLHSHGESDGFWFVLHGRVRFYTTDDVVVAELGENEGVVMPRGYKYWFEVVPSEDELELMRFGVKTKTDVDPELDRVNHEDLKENQTKLLAEKDRLVFTGNSH